MTGANAMRLPSGAVLSLPQLWDFARDWYGAYLDEALEKAVALKRHSRSSVATI